MIRAFDAALRTARRALRSWPRRRPETLLLEVTQRCNLDCKYCYNVWKGATGYPAGELSTREMRALIEKVLRETRCPSLAITGGEPFVRDDIPELIRAARSSGAEVNVVTNATLLDGDLARRSVEAGARAFEVTLLSSERDVHDALARRRAFDATLAGISNILAAGGAITVSFVATKANLRDLRGAIELAVALRARGFVFNRFNPGGEGLRWVEELLPTVAEIAEALEVAQKAREEYGIPIACLVPIPPCAIDPARFPGLHFGACPLGTRDTYFTIDPLGNLRPCNHSPTRLGNLLEERFYKLAGSEEVAAYARAVPRPCAGCRHLRTCRGGCRAAGEVCFGSPAAGDPWIAGLEIACGGNTAAFAAGGKEER